jgi:hypothetical protein
MKWAPHASQFCVGNLNNEKRFPQKSRLKVVQFDHLGGFSNIVLVSHKVPTLIGVPAQSYS